MTPPYHPIVYSSGRIRFWGIDAMRDIRELIRGDDSYTWGLAPWPHEWIDVYPLTIEARDLLLGLVAESGGSVNVQTRDGTLRRETRD